MNSHTDSHVDIALVGSGLVGTPLALMLARRGWRVAVLDKLAPAEQIDVRHCQLDQRCTALSASSRDFLSDESLWSAVASDACAIRRIHVSQQGYFGATRLTAHEEGVEALGYVVDNHRFVASLQPQMQSSSILRLAPVQVLSACPGVDGMQLQYRKQGQSATLFAKLVIAVDGVTSALRDGAGIDTRQVDYSQVGVLGSVKLAGDHAGVAYERFTPSGPLAFLPRPDGVVSFVYCIDPAEQASIKRLSDVDFLAHLQGQFGYRLGRFSAVGARTYVPLIRVEATTQTAKRLILLGNAARLIHPVAGQGYNLALRDCAALLNLLAGPGEARVADPGAAQLLHAFGDSRRNDQQRVVRLSDTLVRAFRGGPRSVSQVRALALMGLDAIAPLRHAFARSAMGYIP